MKLTWYQAAEEHREKAVNAINDSATADNRWVAEQYLARAQIHATLAVASSNMVKEKDK